MPDDCSNCRYHSKETRPKVLGPADLGSFVEFADDDETVYTCRSKDGPRAGEQIGITPVHCSSYKPGSKGSNAAELDALEARLRARHVGVVEK